MPLEFAATLSPKIGFVSHQNAVPLLQELVIRNNGIDPVEDLVLVLSADPVFLEKKIWRIDRLEAGAELRVRDREIRLEAAFLVDLVESVRGEVRIEMREGNAEGVLIHHEVFPVELLAKTHWGGIGSMPELLPAFSMPNDPAIDQVLRAASDVLRRAGKESGIDGYSKHSRSRTWELASAIWSAVSGLGLAYALPAASFEIEGQKIRTPGAVLEGRMATCLDTSMLFVSALEQARLNPLVVLTEGHAFVGVWLQPQEFSQLTTEEALAVRKRVDLQELLVFETTLVTHSPVPSFSVAVQEANRKLNDEEFRMAIDIRRARMRRIKPLGFASVAPAAGKQEEMPTPADALEEAPPLPGFDVEVTEEPKTADDRIVQWQRKLLDLTARNRMLNLPERSKYVPLECPDPGALEDLLAAGKTISISPLPDLGEGGRDLALYDQQNRADLRQQYALDALASQEVLSPLPKKKLEADLIDLYRKANSDMAEGGANTLFLALGFLKWKKSAEDPRSYRAPLILFPVSLRRKSALSGVKMTAHEDEPRFNLTLLELLRQDFELNVTGLDGDLPQDANGIDVRRIWNHVRVAVKEVPGFEVTTDTAIGTFSFAKYLMWKDLVDRREQLTANSVVKHLIERGEERFGGDSDFPSERELDAVIDPANLFAPLPADSSQLAAVVASAKGSNFVLDGPPGTGKSQTIANMIVHNMALGRRVLFVAEKMAALDVVYRRLEGKGLGDFCLEVHSHKASKTDILKQLDRAWEAKGLLSTSQWESETTRLRTLRDRLNKVSSCLHKRHANGMTVHAAIGRVVRDHGAATPRLSWSSGRMHSEEEFEAMRETAHRLDLNYDAFADAPKDFAIIEQCEWSNGWQESVLASARVLPERIEAVIASRNKLLNFCQFSLAAEDQASIGRIIAFVKTILRTHGRNLEFAFAPDLSRKLKAADQFLGLLQEYRQEEEQLSTRYANEAARKVDANRLDSQWAEAERKFWILSSLAKKKVAKELAALGGCSAMPDVPTDSPRLCRMREQLEAMDQLKGRIDDIPGFNFLQTKLDEVREATGIAAELQSGFPSLVSSPDELVALTTATKRLVVDAGGLLAPGGAIDVANASLETALAGFHDTCQRFAELCGLTQSETLTLDAVKNASESVVTHERRLKSWCTWQRVRRDAIGFNLMPLVEGAEDGSIEQGEIQNVFLTAYSKWFAAEMIDQEPVLRGFVAAEHMDRIEEFRLVDDEVARITVEYARSVLAGKLPAKSDVSRRDGFGILKHELQKKRRHKPLRQLATEMGESFGALAPCMLMSPLSIAQYLPAEQQPFDLVIFDEASQIAPWDAVGSIARGRQIVIAGDPRQMPPTNFFQRGTADSDFDGNVEGDLESILDECLAVGIPRHSLSWHYRSRHESLIAFSNHCYYRGNLITFPAAETRESAVSLRRTNGVYAKGKARTNQAEAEAIVAEIVDRLLNTEFAASERSLGIITLNADQQKLIEDLLDKARQEHPGIEAFFDESLSEPVVVKNLETVQGDERDTILLGIGYGPTEPGSPTMSMNFGPLNRDGGERRLNVALSRSREEMVVFTSFDPSMIDLNRTSARAVRDLKHFLEFAERGPRALAEAVTGSVGGYDSPFEEAVARRLQDRGWEVISQVGVSRFRIDLGIVHPDRPGDFLIGIECDGATYHSAATARDRDKVRAAVLEGLGWTLMRVWSTDWFVDPATEIEKLDQAIRSVLDADRERQTDSDSADLEVEVLETPRLDKVASAQPAPGGTIVLGEVDSPTTPNQAMAKGSRTTYRVTDYGDFADAIAPERFQEDSYTPFLITMIRHTLGSEAPIAEDLLVTRIARAHGFKRSGRRIRERVAEIVDEHFYLRNDPVEGAFVWIDETSTHLWCDVREPASDDSIRSVHQIPAEEIQACLGHVEGEETVREIARFFGIQRLSTSGRERIESVIFIHGESKSA